jgi:ADP-heptose:LPS heptosyltransferase/predicted SAM-dependent methyltransferase
MTWNIDDSQGNESGKIVWETVPYTRGRGLDLGCGAYKVWPHAIGVDNYSDTVLFKVAMKPDVVSSVTKLDVFGSASMDWVYSSHVLEHVEFEQVPDTLREWMRVLKPSGYLILYLPDEDEYPKVGEEGANPDHKWNVNIDRVVGVMKKLGGWDLVRCEKRNADLEYSIFFVFQKRGDKQQLYSHKKPRPEKRAAVVRYGAFGDAIQASSILPGLKEQGYHVTFYCTPRTQEVLQHDPHIDEWYVQDTDQVPNSHLGTFWDHEAKKFDKWINLSETVEGTLLTLPGRPNHKWPKNLRHRMLDVNYMEFTHEFAGVPMPPVPKFYSTPEEKVWARKERAKFGGDMLILYPLSGSAIHKVWPNQDSFFARVLIKYPGARIVTVGDMLSTVLEQGWENEPRIVKKASKYTIRESMALAEVCDVAVGPETGMMNAVSHLSMPKVVLLSHSSANNLTKYWVNTTTIEPQTTPCYPCHRMIYTFDDCVKDEETGTAACQADISTDQVWNAFEARKTEWPLQA